MFGRAQQSLRGSVRHVADVWAWWSSEGRDAPIQHTRVEVRYDRRADGLAEQADLSGCSAASRRSSSHAVRQYRDIGPR